MKKLLLLLLLSGCYTHKKAVKDTSRAVEKFPDIGATVLRSKFPCIPTKDSIVTYITNDSLWTEVINELQSDLVSAYALQDSLAGVLRMDTGCAEYDVIIARLQRDNKVLAEKFKHIPPVIKETRVTKLVEDSAKLFLLNEQIVLLNDGWRHSQSLTQKELDSKRWWRKRAMWTWFLLVVGLCGGYVLKKRKLL